MSESPETPAPERLSDVLRVHWRRATTLQKAELVLGAPWWVALLAWYAVRQALRRGRYWRLAVQLRLVVRMCVCFLLIGRWARRQRERGERWQRTRPWAIAALLEEEFPVDKQASNHLN